MTVDPAALRKTLAQCIHDHSPPYVTMQSCQKAADAIMRLPEICALNDAIAEFVDRKQQ